ncbi:hypothetical protein EMIHUDRAFT_106650 [Emiliania huxleyi CCMP1516]|uniref:CUE domain-containing protein n=2 Tax=Emiliania huxleyi TaxID=2903 RepID=A0A0D3I6T8_EMIH1|nr:hypothetical protein EMIHUDRAFT_106650 [Emiliania huxleyi CCMP1516]EOD06973.1 hypothetical protein EMIHUDRAFT_106650 [Emiliania huxleyi CCMP1516]|eukprot:XP_005759402.1 hypothetical protein EMIHUDRAFT_106650 [Emiliania huxleyi CCMP1516]
MTGRACPWFTSLDEDVEAYVRSVAEDAESDSDLDGIVDLLAAHGIGTEGSEDMRAELRCLREQSATAAPASGRVERTSTACCGENGGGGRGGDVSSCSSSGGGGSGSGRSSSRSSGRSSGRSCCASGASPTGGRSLTAPLAPPTPSTAELTLLEVVPAASAALARHVLRCEGGDVQAAIEVLLGGSLETLEEEMRAEQQRAAQLEVAAAAQQQRQRKVDRRRVLGRYDAQRDFDAEGGAPPPLEPPRLPYAQSRKEAVGGNRTMYRDGEAVYVKGNPKQESKWEKKEEWDGGSTGRVKTKGKRGPGWR